MKLLLHICCAPCLIYPLERLRQQGFEVTGLFYNPNVHPFAEYNNRMHSAQHYSGRVGLEIIYPDYEPSQFFRAVNTMEDKPQRCPICWFLRLSYTALLARQKGYTNFSSTLLASVYQDQDALRKIGSNIAKEEGIDFYYEDFRPGFKEAHNEARAQGIYCQKYCGCIYSEVERCRRSEKH